MLYNSRNIIFALMLLTTYIHYAMELMEVTTDPSATFNAGSDELLSTDSSDVSHSSPRDAMEAIIDQYIQTQNEHHTIVSTMLQSDSISKLVYLQMLAATPAIFDNALFVESFEQTNIYYALTTNDLAIIEFVMNFIQDFSLALYDNLLIEVVKIGNATKLIQKMKAMPKIAFNEKIDRCMISICGLESSPRDTLALLLQYGANPTEGLSWYCFNGHTRDIKLFVNYGADIDKIYLEILKSKNEIPLLTLTSIKLPKDHNLVYELFSYAAQYKSLPLLFNLLKQLILEKRCSDPEFDMTIPLSHVENIHDCTKGLLMHIASLCASNDFFDYCKDPSAYTQNAIDLYTITQANYASIKKICWWSALFNIEEPLQFLATQLTSEDYNKLVNERGSNGFTTLSYNALFSDTNLTLELMSRTEKKMDLVTASYFASKYNYPIVVQLLLEVRELR